MIRTSKNIKTGDKRIHSDMEGDNVPPNSNTNDCNVDVFSSDLQLSFRYEEDPRSLFIIGYHRFLGRNVHHKEFMRKHYLNPDEDYLAKESCLQFALAEWENMINTEVINDVQAVDVFQMNQELEKPFLHSAFNEYLLKEDKKFEGSELLEHVKEKKKLLQETCQKIYTKIKLFSDQLLSVVSHKKSASERMMQDLFLSFVKIFDLTIFDTTYSPNLGFYFHNGRNVIQSEPDALILSNKLTPEMEIESKVIAVVKVRQNYSNDRRNEPPDKKLKVRSVARDKMTGNIAAEHIDPLLKGQHIGDMLAVAESSSVFGQNGVFGFIVQGTKVTLVSLETKKEYFEYIKTKDQKLFEAEVTYSKECNFLSKNGRKELIPILLGMEKLVKL
ncbi:uncharacterized protein LOC143048333 [Mytilus galloprovincialis]|uniref:uncharacterized protein LOC143048333 n=1 Tax=Mytilus galloprovincialis TaxID=29158 RepID=UPI003F7BD3FD